MSAPGAGTVMRAVSTLQQVKEQLRAICPDIEQDDTLFADMLEAEAGDALAVIERLVQGALDAEDHAEAAGKRLADLAERRARFERRAHACRTVALAALEAINLRKLERPHFTVSIYQQKPPLLVDEQWLPSEWWRSKREPKRAEIRAALSANEKIPGAQFGNPMPGLSIRTR
jgi:hypothetical protein